jgi:hypothetical protein
MSRANVYRYLDEVIEVLAARAPGLREQLERALGAGVPYLILDGKIVATDRCREKTTSRKGKTNVLGVLRPLCDAMPVLADPGYEGAGHGVHVPVKKAAGHRTRY